MSRTVFSLIVIASAATGALAQTTYTFQATDGDWGTGGNWDPPQVPGADDTAIIPNGKTCKVQSGNQHITDVEVASGGTLGIVGRILTAHPPYAGVASITVNGTLYFKSDGGGNRGVLRLNDRNGVIQLGGSGLVTARKADGYGSGLITAEITGGAAELDVSSTTLTVAGTLEILTRVANQGVILVDGSQDEMLLGPTTFRDDWISGAGEFRCSAGAMRIRAIEIEPSAQYLDWKVSGGTMQFNSACACTGLSSPFAVSGGTLDIDADLSTTGHLDFTGGTISVAAGKCATFEGAPTGP